MKYGWHNFTAYYVGEFVILGSRGSWRVYRRDDHTRTLGMFKTLREANVFARSDATGGREC